MSRNSRLSGFYQKSIDERVALVAQWAGLDEGEVALLRDGLTLDQADRMSENVIARYSLPLGVGANFIVNGIDYLVPMATEEPSVVAAASYAARLARTSGGFIAGSTQSVMVAQIQLLEVPDFDSAEARILAARAELLAAAATSASILRAGGGPREISIRRLPETPTGPMLIVHLHVDVRDAMGANAVNTAAEAIAPQLQELSGGRTLLRILTNLTDERRAWAETLIPADAFSTELFAGEEVIENIAHANAFAVADPWRAATHNKGILNGIDSVAVATGNDWRAIEAGAHAWAARDGHYRALTDWRVIDSIDAVPYSVAAEGAIATEPSLRDLRVTESDLPLLYGRIELPMAVGIVGGATRAHPLAAIALKILGIGSARQLGEVMASVGLAQNLGALRALATEGIQQGHMRLHGRAKR